MNLARTLYIILTYPNRLRHRLGYGVQSPWAYEMVRDVLFEKLHYYAYEEKQLRTASDRQLWRIENYFRSGEFVYIPSGRSASDAYEQTARMATENTAVVIDGMMGDNASLWKRVLADSRATVTFDMGSRGLVTFDKKRIKQNYTL